MIRLALAVVALPVLVFAGIKIYPTLSEEFKKPQLPAGPDSPIRAGVETGPDQNNPEWDAARSRVSVYQRANGSGAGATVAALGMPFLAQGNNGGVRTPGGILQRAELIRQAFLIDAGDSPRRGHAG